MATHVLRGIFAPVGMLLFITLLPPLPPGGPAPKAGVEAGRSSPSDSARIEELLRASQSLQRRNYYRAAEKGLEALVLAYRCGSERQRATANAVVGWSLAKQLPTDSVRWYFRRAVDGARRCGDRRIIISALQGLATLKAYDGKSAEATALVDSAWKLAEKDLDSASIASLLWTRGFIEYQNLNAEAALPHLSRALDIYRSTEDSVGIINAMIQSASVMRRNIRYSPADSLCRLALEITRRRNDSCQLLDATYALGAIAGIQGLRDSAASLFEQARSLAILVGDVRMMVRSTLSLGLNRNRANLPLEGRAHLLQANELATKLRDSSQHQIILLALAGNYGMTADYDSASLYFARRHEMLVAQHDSTWLADHYRWLSDMLERRGQIDSAMIVMRESVRCARARGDVEILLVMLFSQGRQEYDYGLYRIALERFHECERLLEGTDPANYHWISLHTFLTKTYTSMKQWDKAIVHCSRAIQASEARKNVEDIQYRKSLLANVFYHRGKTEGRRKDLDTARSILNSILASTPKYKGAAINLMGVRMLGGVLSQLGESDSALSHLQCGLALVRETNSWREEPLYLHMLSLALHRAGRFQDAFDTLHVAVKKFKNQRYPVLIRDVLEDASIICEEQGRYREALEFQREYDELNDSLMNAEHMALLADADARYENSQKRQELATLENERRLNLLRIERQQEELRRQRAEAEGNRQRLRALAQQRELDRLRLENHDKQMRFTQMQLRVSRMRDSMLMQANAGLATTQRLQAEVLDWRTQLLQAMLAVLVLLLFSGFLLFRRFRGRQREAVLRAQAAELQRESALLAARSAELQAQAAEAESLRLAAETERREKEHQRSMTRNLFDAQEHERKRIASDLHDSVGQELVIIKNRAMLAAETPDEPEAQRVQLERIIEMTGKAMATVREITHNLRPSELDRLGLTAALRAIVDATRDGTGLRLHAEIAMIDRLFEPEHEILIYRIVQEALCNIVRHAQARNAWLTVMLLAGTVELRIEDDGHGFPLSADGTPLLPERRGLGLDGMRERATMLGGSLRIGPRNGSGAALHISIPVPIPEHKPAIIA